MLRGHGRPVLWEPMKHLSVLLIVVVVAFAAAVIASSTGSAPVTHTMPDGSAMDGTMTQP